jgi:hypothetical protein
MRGMGMNTVSQVLSGIVSIEGYLQVERVLSLYDSIFLFPVATALSIALSQRIGEAL